MDTMAAFAMGRASRNNRPRVFDWHKAARLIKEKNPAVAGAGLAGDWEYTGGTIYANGKADTDSYTYLASTWAAPEIEIDGEKQDCWVYCDESDWDCHTKWPKSALKILSE